MTLQNSIRQKKNPSRIIGIQFSILSPEEIRKNSLVEIVNRDTFINNKPMIGGLFDPRMGSIDPEIICPTDGLSYIETPGYFGHIELARPVFFMQHFKEIIKICKCVCFKCSKLLIDKENHRHIIDWDAEKRWDYVYENASKVKRCSFSNQDGCGCKQFDRIKLDNMSHLYAIWEKLRNENDETEDINVRMTPEVVLKIFKRISDDDIHFMGFSPKFSRPEWLICEVLAVPPPAVRPSVKHDANQRSEDDLTQIYATIIKTNNDLKEKIKTNASAQLIDSVTSYLQYYIANIANNKIKGSCGPMQQRSGRPLQCIRDRLDGKTGRIRGNLMGKRVDYSARSVITADPNLSIRELGVPMKIAKNLTKPITVNDKNRDFLTKLVQNGPEEYPGAKILERKNGENISLRYVDRLSIRLENGDIVHRHLMNGDAVIFNRQPSLHRMSMMCHIVRIMTQGDTFRMNVADTKPYNADFDGDEMNMHLPQNITAEAELRNLAAIPYQIVSPSSNTPIIGIYQDSLLGSYQITREGLNFTPREAMNLLMMFSRVDTKKLMDAAKTNKGKVSCFDVISQIMPPLTIRYKTKLFEEEPNQNMATSNHVLEIRNGEYIRGQMEKGVLGSGSKGILHRICNDYGNMACSDFIDNLQNIVTEYMKQSSYSVGISDLIADSATQDKIIEEITKQKREVQLLLDKVQLGIFENNTAQTNAVEFEKQVNAILNKAADKAGKIGRDNLEQNNRFVTIVKCGSKGSTLNISQMISCLGQQNVDGKRIPYGFDSRTLPHFTKFDDSPGARGFIENSYINGLTPPELFFHAMAGRIGLIDTACKTSSTGYIQRRLIKGLEDLKIEYDMTVRNSKGKIIQFTYGDDGADTVRIESQVLKLGDMSIEDIFMFYDFALEENTTKLVFTKATATKLNTEITELKKKCTEYIERMLEYRDDVVKNVFKYKNENDVKAPVAFSHIINNIQGQMMLGANSLVDITPMTAFQLIEENFEKLRKMRYASPNRLFEILYYYFLNPRDLLIVKRFNRHALIILLEQVNLMYKRSLVNPGEMVGIIAGQSIGEPTTQMTLNTFHYSGISSKSNVTRGVPRIEEILRLTKNPKNPSLTVYLKQNEEHDKDKAIQYTHMLEHTKFIDVVKHIQICFDPNEKDTMIEQDKMWLKQYYDFEDMIGDCEGIETTNITQKSKWVIRIELDAETMLDKNITMDDLHYAITSHSQDITCAFTDYNADQLIFRIRMNGTIFNKTTKKKNTVNTLDQTDELYLLNNFQETLLNSVVLRGITGIVNVLPRKIQGFTSFEDGKYIAKDKWVLDTTGSNLLQVLALDYIDGKRTYSNDIKEIHHVLGIEATRQIIYNEMQEVISFSGAYVNSHHLQLLADRMTCTKNLVSIFRSGILNDDIGPIAKATFEVHTEEFLNAARHSALDHMRGISANVMTGQNGYYGTSAFQLVLDMNAISNIDPVSRDTEDPIMKGLMEEFGKTTIYDECSTDKIKITNNVDFIKKVDLGSTTCLNDDNDIGF